MNDLRNNSGSSEEILRRRIRAEKRLEVYKRRRRQIIRRRRIALGTVLAVIVLIIGTAVLKPVIQKAVQQARADQEAGRDPEMIAAEQESTVSEIAENDPTAQPEAADAAGAAMEGGSGAEAQPEPYGGYTGEVGSVFQPRFTENTQYLGLEEVQSSYGVLIDADTGEVLYQRDAEAVVSPASMTKILTLLVAVEHITDIDDTFTMTEEIKNFSYVNGCSDVGFMPDEVITVRDLLYGTILESGADAALGLAYYTAGSPDTFVQWMNDKLAQFGLSDTAHFTNCIGIYDEAHHCTMSDMAVILAEAVKYPLCCEVLNARRYTTSQTEIHPDGIEISNWFLRRIEDKDCNGNVLYAKTGFVNESGSCAASYLESNSGRHYICVTGNAWSAWRCIYDHVAIYSTYTE